LDVIATFLFLLLGSAPPFGLTKCQWHGLRLMEKISDEEYKGDS
jgi:hypothetical protein